jgi:hypothetical protein
MKRQKLIRELEKAGCRLDRNGARHDLYLNPANGTKAPVPRHTEIKETLCPDYPQATRPDMNQEALKQVTLVASGNTYNPSLLALREKGYDVWLESSGDDDRSLWCARKDDHSFLAYSGPELLGLVALHEHFGDDWNRQEPDLYGQLIDRMDA